MNHMRLCSVALIMGVVTILPGNCFAQNLQTLDFTLKTDETYHFELTPTPQKETLSDEIYLPAASTKQAGTYNYSSKSKKKSKDLEEQIMAIIPYSDRMKKLWNVVNGDTDLFMEGLRVEKGNKGLRYTTNYIPLMGDMDNLELQFDAGDDMEFSFESRKVPFIKSENFRINGSVSDDSEIFARYTISLDKL